jgi:hypothetical protein
MTALIVLIASSPLTVAQDLVGTESPSPNTIRLEPDPPRRRATLDAVAWLARRRMATAWGGVGEEVWSTPAAGTMMGMLRVLKPAANGWQEVGFYDFLTFVEQNDALALKLNTSTPVGREGSRRMGFVTSCLACLTWLWCTSTV